jgi:hypothetical protein
MFTEEELGAEVVREFGKDSASGAKDVRANRHGFKQTMESSGPPEWRIAL